MIDIERTAMYGCVSDSAMSAVCDVVKECDLPIVADGGISNGRDDVEYLIQSTVFMYLHSCNCTATQVCVRIAKEMKEFMNEDSYKHIDKIVYVEHKHPQYM